MPLSDDKWKVVLNRIRLSAMDKNVILPKDNVEALRREFDKMLVDEPGGDAVMYERDPKVFLDKYVTTSKEFKPRGKRRKIPFRRAAWNRVNKLIGKYADEAGVRIVNAKPMKAAIGEDMKVFLDTNRVSGEGLDRVGDAKVADFIKGWFAGEGAKYQKKRDMLAEARAVRDKPELVETLRARPGQAARDALKEVKDEAAEQAALSEVKEEAERAAERRAAERGDDGEAAAEAPLDVPFGMSRAGHKAALERQREAMLSLSGQYLDHVKPDDMLALKAAAKSYQFIGADKGETSFVGRMVGQTTTYQDAPTLEEGWKPIYSDQYQTIWDDGRELIVAYTGTDSVDDYLPDIKIAAKVPGEYALTMAGSIETDPRILSVVETTNFVIHTPLNRGKRVLFTGHSLGAATSYVAYDKFSRSAFSPTQYRVVGWELPWPMAADKPPGYIDGEKRRAYVMPGDPISDRLVLPGSAYNQKGTFIIITEGSDKPQRLSTRHSIDTLLKHEEKVSQAHRAETAAVLSAEVEEEVAAVEEDKKMEDLKIPDFIDYVAPGMEEDPGVEEEQEGVKQEAPGVGETPEVKTDAASGLGEGGPDPGAEETVSTATGDRFRGVPGMGVPAAEPGSGTFGDVVRPELQAAVNANFHRYGKSFRQYIADFVSSSRYSVMKAETGGDGHGGLDRLIDNYGSEIGVTPFDHRELDDAAMAVLYAEVAAIVDWFLRNPERLPSRAINRLSVLLETKLFPAPEGTPVEQMTDDQLLAQMATRGAVVKVDPSTGRDRALAAVKDLLPGAGGAPSSVEAHPSGAATGDAAEAPGNVAGQPDEVDADGVVEIIDEDTFRLDTTKFLDTTGGTATRYDFALPMENGYSLSFATEDDE